MNSRNVYYVTAFILACLLGFYAYQKPVYDWDMLAYAAVQYQWQGLNDEQTHRKIYQDILPGLGDSVKQFLTEKEYEQLCAKSPAYFNSQLPFYTIKPLYNGLVYVFSKFSLTFLQAMRLISALSYVVLILMIVWLMMENRNDTFDKFSAGLAGVFIGVLICAVPIVMTPARMLTPDLLSSTLLISATLLYLLLNRFHLAMILFLLSIAVRPDNAATTLIAIIMIAFFDAQRRRWRFIALYSIITFIIYFLIAYFFSGYGWKITFQHSVIDLAKPINEWENIPLTINEYFKWLLYQVVYSRPLLVPALLLAVLSYFAMRKLTMEIFDKKLIAIWWILLLSAIIKFAAFPRFDLRYYIPQYILFAAMVAFVIVNQRRKNLAS